MPDGSCTQSTLHQYMELKGPAPQVNPVVLKGLKFFLHAKYKSQKDLKRITVCFGTSNCEKYAGTKRLAASATKLLWVL